MPKKEIKLNKSEKFDKEILPEGLNKIKIFRNLNGLQKKKIKNPEEDNNSLFELDISNTKNKENNKNENPDKNISNFINIKIKKEVDYERNNNLNCSNIENDYNINNNKWNKRKYKNVSVDEPDNNNKNVNNIEQEDIDSMKFRIMRDKTTIDKKAKKDNKKLEILHNNSKLLYKELMREKNENNRQNLKLSKIYKNNNITEFRKNSEIDPEILIIRERVMKGIRSRTRNRIQKRNKKFSQSSDKIFNEILFTSEYDKKEENDFKTLVYLFEIKYGRPLIFRKNRLLINRKIKRSLSISSSQLKLNNILKNLKDYNKDKISTYKSKNKKIQQLDDNEELIINLQTVNLEKKNAKNKIIKNNYDLDDDNISIKITNNNKKDKKNIDEFKHNKLEQNLNNNLKKENNKSPKN